MKDQEAPKHLNPGQIEAAALDDTTLHLLTGCTACAESVLRYAQERETIPFDQYPTAE